MKKITVFLLLVAIITTSIVFVGCKKKIEFKGTEYDPFNSSILDWAVIPENDEQAMIELAVKMYNHANECDKNVHHRKYSTYGLIKSGIKTERYIFNVKNGNEWYMSECQYQPNIILNAIPGANSFLDLKYANLMIGKTLTIHTEDDVNIDTQTGVPSGNLNNATRGEEDMPIFNASQEGDCFQTDFVIRVDTVLSAKVTHNDELGYFDVEIVLDVKNPDAVAVPLANLKKSADDAEYTSCIEYIQIWDSGFYKYFNAVDKWTGTPMVKVNAVIDYKTYFVYEEEECVIDNYYGINDLKGLIDLNETF